MIYTVIIERSAKKQLDKIPPPFFDAIDKKILALETNPRPNGWKKLKDRDGWRIRVADYRIIYKIKDDILRIIVINVDHRKQVYQ
jgi:mRNA interferase RelE/StbE